MVKPVYSLYMQPETLPALKIRNVTTMYGNYYGVENISFDVKAGEVFGFLGPNGAGKSTMINTILDLLRPESGTIEIFGADNRRYGAMIRHRIGYLSGDMATDPTLTGVQYLSYVASLRGGVKNSTIDELADRLKCDLSKKIRHLSRGSKQKIGLISALMHDPDLLILDEPTSGLDPLIQAEFNEIIREHSARGKTTLISSHVLSEVQAVCNRVGFIREGKLIKLSPLDDLISEATKLVVIVFVEQPPDDLAESIDGISHLETTDRTVTFQFKGDDDALLKLLATYQVLHIQISEPDLSRLFMGYYQEKSDVS